MSAISPRLGAYLTSFLYFVPKKSKGRIGAMSPEPELIEIPTEHGKVHRFYAWGQGPTVLFVHGWGGSGRQCRHLIKPALEAGLRLVTFDAPAHGENKERTTSGLCIAGCIKQFAAAQPGLEAIVAHSFGGIVALMAINDGVKVSSLALVAPPDPDLVVTKFAALLRLSDETVMHHKRLIEKRFKPLGVNPWVAFSLQRLAATKVRTLVIHDRADEEIELEEGRRVAHVLRASCHLVTTGYGHQRVLASPEAIAGVIEFVDKRPASAKAGASRAADVVQEAPH